jgi:nucleoside-diphosphate-sugar epimerase
MKIPSLIRLRFKRGFSLSSLGPNEARIVYDFFLGTITWGLATLFSWFFLYVVPNPITMVIPFALIVMIGVLGIYTRFKNATGFLKSVLLLLAVGGVTVLYCFLSGQVSTAILWALLVGPNLCLARILLNIPHSKHRGIVTVAVKQRGPVLVIGGAGYIGCHIIEQLLNSGRSVRVLDRLMYGRDAISGFMNHANFEFIEGDVTNITKLTTAMSGVAGVVHLAGLVGDPACAVDPGFTRHTNIISTRMAKDVAQSMGIHRFVFASSCSVYGATDQEVAEEDPLNPVSLYAQTKIDSERELIGSTRDDFVVTILRFATVFGHSRRPRFDLVGNLFTAQAVNNGLLTVIGPDQWRPFIHVRDLARAVVLVLTSPTYAVHGQIFNVGDKRLNMTILQLAQGVKDIVERGGREVEITVSESVEDRRNYAVSFEKIRSILGFEAETLLEGGINEMVQAFQDGLYGDYREEIYSNVAMTQKALDEFQDPMQVAGLYAPLQDSD